MWWVSCAGRFIVDRISSPPPGRCGCSLFRILLLESWLWMECPAHAVAQELKACGGGLLMLQLPTHRMSNLAVLPF